MKAKTHRLDTNSFLNEGLMDMISSGKAKHVYIPSMVFPVGGITTGDIINFVYKTKVDGRPAKSKRAVVKVTHVPVVDESDGTILLQFKTMSGVAVNDDMLNTDSKLAIEDDSDLSNGVKASKVHTRTSKAKVSTV